MEVHHHTHTARKKFLHYFWEFFMLFLAVTLGFFVENLREHTIEHKREKDYIKTLREDLTSDTSDLDENIGFWKDHYLIIDSFRRCIKKPFLPANLVNCYQLAALMYDFAEFNYSDRTIDQLRSSGNFRLIASRKITNALSEYDNTIKNKIRSQEAAAKNLFMSIVSQQGELLNTDIIKTIKEQGTPISSFNFQEIPPGKNSDKINKLAGDLLTYEWLALALYKSESSLKKQALVLKSLIEKEYHLK
jgi:hypothetical protein